MILDISKTWPGKASLVQTKKGFVIIHLRSLPYNKFETELWDADKNGVALLSDATLYEGEDVFDKWIKKYEFKPRKSRVPSAEITSTKEQKAHTIKAIEKVQEESAKDDIIEYSKGTNSHDIKTANTSRST